MLRKGILSDDTYRVFVPIEDNDLLKSVEVDENGDYVVQGVMSSEDTDEEDDSISPEGMDCSYFLEKGWIKYEHGNSPNQFIGEPLEVKVGQFEHPTKHKLVKGIFVKGRLFAQRELAKQAVKAIEDLQKSNTKRKMGWSIEGNVKDRDRKTGKIVKSILRNVVLTMNPVNTMTWAELSKSFAKNHELTIDMDVEKAMDTDAMAPLARQSIEGYKPSEEEDEQQDWINFFREFVKAHYINKSLRTKFIASEPGAVGTTAYSFGLERGLSNEDAYEFASYIADRQEVLKSLFRANYGGETMSKIASLLDADLEELRKSLEMEDEEELEKSVDTGEGEGDENPQPEKDEEEKDEEGDGDGDEEKDEEGDGDGDEEKDEEGDEEGDEETEKSLKTDFAKSLASHEENAQALEVSDFLANLADEVGFSMDGFAKSMTHVTKQQNAIVKSLVSFGDLMKSLVEKVEDLQSENSDLKKSLNDLLEKPLGRRSVTSTREVATISKSIETPGAGRPLNRAQISEVLVKSFEAGEIDGTTIARFEAGISLDGLKLPKTVMEKLR